MRQVRDHHTGTVADSQPRSGSLNARIVWWCDKCVLQLPQL